MKRNMKRIYKGLVSGALSIGMLCAGWSVPMAYAAGNISVYIDGNYLRTDIPPYIKNGYTMLPMRAVYENLGANVRYNSQSKEIIVSADGDVLKLYIGRKTAYLNGSPISLSVSPEIKNGRTMVGLRDGAELIGADIDWDSRTREISIWTDGDGYDDDDWYYDDEYSFDDIKEGEWNDTRNKKISLSINRTGWNTAEIQIYWGGGSSSINGVDYDNGFRDFDGIRWNLTCKWNSDENILEYENGMCFGWFVGDEGLSHSYLLDQDCTGYLYLDSGSLYWVDDNESVSENCRFTHK